MKYLLILASCFFLGAANIDAHYWFSEGDAYIYFKIDQKTYSDLKKDQPIEIKGEFGTLHIKDKSGSAREQLVKFYKSYRGSYGYTLQIDPELVDEDGNLSGNVQGKSVKDNSPLHCFVYNKSYDLEKYLVGLKYNESWVFDNEKDKKESRRRGLLVKWSIDANYKNAKLVDGLKATSVKDKITVDTKEACLIVMADDHWRRFKSDEWMDGVVLYRIANGKATKFKLISEFGNYSFRALKQSEILGNW